MVARQAGVGGQTEAGSGLGHDERRTRPADVLVPNWDLGKPAAFDLTVASPLNQSILNEACATAGSSPRVSEQRKHASNDVKCSELGWSCIPLAVETYGCWGAEARLHLSRLASRLAARLNCSKSHATSTLYGRLNLVLVRANARALLSRAYGVGSDIPLNYSLFYGRGGLVLAMGAMRVVAAAARGAAGEVVVGALVSVPVVGLVLVAAVLLLLLLLLVEVGAALLLLLVATGAALLLLLLLLAVGAVLLLLAADVNFGHSISSCRLYQSKVNSCQGDLGRQSKKCVVTWKRRCLHSRDCGPGDCSGSLQAREMMEGQLNNSVTQYPRGTGQLNFKFSFTEKAVSKRDGSADQFSYTEKAVSKRDALASHIMTFKPHQVDGYNLVRTFAAVHTARMGKLVPCHHSGAWQKPSLDIIWKKNDLKID
ncbi:hypothetical protein EMCRGX_G004082 [Ephydatia muelleri]